VVHRVRLGRLADLEARGWWGGDLHVHMNYGGVYRSDPTRLRAQAEAEDLRVVQNLIVNKEARIPDIAWFGGRLDPASTSTTLIRHDEEYHTSWWGHTALLGLNRHVVLPNYAGYVNTAAASLFPHNTAVADLARAQGGLMGYVHPFDLPPDPDGPEPLTHALPVDVALGRVAFLEVLGFSDHRTTAAVWYRLLNAGFAVPAGAGTDAMTNFASLRGPVGMNRVYVRSGPRLDHRGWLAALARGRTFVTNGPLLAFTLGGAQPGDSLRLGAGRHDLAATAWLRSIVPVDSLEVVRNGRVVHAVALAGGGTEADARFTLPVEGSGWYVLRAWAPRGRHPVLDIHPYATTSPVYVSVGGAPIRSPGDARFFARWVQRLEDEAARHPGWNDAAERDRILADLRQARAVWERLASGDGR
jgi:TolB protein